MPRRVNLPGASELFRPTAPGSDVPGTDVPETDVPETDGGTAGAPGDRTEATAPARGSGRVRHEEKITVYVSREELLALEQARLLLRAEHGMAVDRGRIVREAVSALVADLHDRGGESELVRRLAAP